MSYDTVSPSYSLSYDMSYDSICCDMGHVGEVRDIADMPIGHNATFVTDVRDNTKMSR